MNADNIIPDVFQKFVYKNQKVLEHFVYIFVK